MNAKIENISVQGICSYVPENVEDNMQFASLLGERRVKRQIRLTGIRKRHTSVRFQYPSDLAGFATEKLIRELGWNKEEIGVLIYVTQKGDYLIPSTAIRMQERLGLPKECVAYDINLGCSAFNYGVYAVAAILNTSQDYKKGLCLIADSVKGLISRRNFNKESISFSMLSGSAASAVALEKEEGVSMLFFGSCDGSNYDAIIKTSFYRDTMMKGNVVFEFAINDVSQSILDFKKKYGLSEQDIDYYVFHQAQKLMLENMISTCELPLEKVLFSLEEYGNTSGASVPLTVNANAELLKKKEKVRLLLCGFGVGLSCGITFLEMKTEHIMAVGETNDFFDVEKLPRKKLHDLNIMIFEADEKLGEYLAVLLDEQDPFLILCGHDEQKLKELQKKLHRESEIICYQNNEEFKKKTGEINIESIDGIVNISDEILAEWIAEQNFSKEELSIVLLGTEERVQRLNRLEHSMRKKCENVRVNMVCYQEDSLQIYVPQNGEPSWGHKFLAEDLPSDMIRANYLYRGIEFFLYKDSRFISGSVIRVSEKIDWF